MNERKVVMFTVIAVCFIFTITSAATYAYFAANINNDGQTDVHAKLPKGSGSCEGAGGGESTTEKIVIAVDMTNDTTMINEEVPKGTVYSSPIYMTSKSPDENTNVRCTYDVTWKWGEMGYQQSKDLNDKKEFTYTLEESADQERWTTLGSENVQFASASGNDIVTLKEGVQLDSEGVTSKTKYYRVKINWYNVGVDQSIHAGAAYSGTLMFSLPTVYMTDI